MTAAAPTSAAISRALAHAGVGVRIRDLDIWPGQYRSTFPIHELEIAYVDGTTASLVAKQVDWPALTSSGRDLLHDACREARVYETLLAPADVGTAAFHGAAGGLLLLENVDATPLWQVDDLEVWCAVARWLARFHHRFADLEDGRARAARLIRYDPPFLRLWLDRARSVVPPDALEPIARVHEAAVEHLAAEPQTLVHGEFYPSNVLVAAGSSGMRICPVDWETAALGPGALDLAALVTGWAADSADAVVEAYRVEAPHADGSQFAKTLRFCRLHLALRWLGWSEGWSPPPEHRQDWLGEARRLAAEIDG